LSYVYMFYASVDLQGVIVRLLARE